MPTKHLEDLLLLGDPGLYEVSAPVSPDEKNEVGAWVRDLHQVMFEIRAKYRFGRGIAAPQLGIRKRLIYLNLNRPYIIINPVLKDLNPDLFEVWDDCMCFPNLLVRVLRHRSLTLEYLDENWEPQTWHVEDDIAELIQHEYDHLEGILCTMRAIDDVSFRWRPTPA
jgi:peptide deformylase